MSSECKDGALLTSDLDYELPEDLVARYPVSERDDSRLLVIHRATQQWEHGRFRDLPDWLHAGDCLVLNRTRVRPARTFGKRASGGRVELLWLRREGPVWSALARPAGRLKPGERIELEGGLAISVVERAHDGLVKCTVPDGVDLEAWLDGHGHMPIPPYLGRDDEPSDRERYQTVFARESGAVAAPTAGLHFTPRVFETLSARGVGTRELLLHVGPGTFRPVTSERVTDHKLDPEWYHIPESSWRALQETREGGGRVVAVGTTVVRSLECAARTVPPLLSGWSDLLISPPFDFGQVDALVTNFHLPRSSLLALVAAFAGLDLVREAYRAAVRERYRFYSYGDAMLIL